MQAGTKISAFALLLVVACGSPAVETRGPARPIANDDPITFERGEDEVLRDLSAIDGRFARRARIEPSEEDLRRVAMSALLHEDSTLAMNGGAIDPFSFDARGRGLDAVKVRLSTLPNIGTERELLFRLVDAEAARLDEERALPRSASALINAIVETWTPPKDERAAAEDDRWLARRLEEVHDAMTSTTDPNASLDVVRARELDDALDALERMSRGLVKATQELVRVRDALETVASRPAAKARSDWELVGRRLRAQVGIDVPSDELAHRLDALEKELREKAELAVAMNNLDRRTFNDKVEKELFVLGPCVDATPGSRVRSLQASREREASCHLRKLVAAANDPRARAMALVRMHAHVVVAQWALEVALGTGVLAEARGRHHMLVPIVQPATVARLERIALARPATALAAGETVRLLASGDRDPVARATAWALLGDIPLDIAERELH